MARQAPTFPSGYAVFHAKVVGCPQPKFGRLREKALSLRRVAGGGGEKFGVPANLPNRNACRQPEPEMMVWHHSQRQRSRYRRTMPVVPQLGHIWGGVTADWWASTGGFDAAVRDGFGKGELPSLPGKVTAGRRGKMRRAYTDRTAIPTDPGRWRRAPSLSCRREAGGWARPVRASHGRRTG